MSGAEHTRGRRTLEFSGSCRGEGRDELQHAHERERGRVADCAGFCDGRTGGNVNRRQNPSMEKDVRATVLHDEAERPCALHCSSLAVPVDLPVQGSRLTTSGRNGLPFPNGRYPGTFLPLSNRSVV